uniref:F-box protein n=1 Tax=Kalanchoe fedtschenkoi TaxID=63787 RepID=A0A7N0TP85_KALFE
MQDVSASRHPPPWEVVALVAQSLDPKTLAMASCVCKSWFSCFSTDHRWESICRAEFPSVSNLKLKDPSVPYRTLYSLGLSAAKRRRQVPPKPTLGLSDLMFAIEIVEAAPQSTSKVAHLLISGDELETTEHALFNFDVAFAQGVEVDDVERLKVVWNVVLRGWKGVFCLMECEGKVVAGGEGWFSAEAAAAGCCCREAAAGSGLTADLRLGFCRDDNGGGDEKKRKRDKMMKVVKVSMGLLSNASWRYACMDDGLRYLQHFL